MLIDAQKVCQRSLRSREDTLNQTLLTLKDSNSRSQFKNQIALGLVMLFLGLVVGQWVN